MYHQNQTPMNNKMAFLRNFIGANRPQLWLFLLACKEDDETEEDLIISFSSGFATMVPFVTWPAKFD